MPVPAMSTRSPATLVALLLLLSVMTSARADRDCSIYRDYSQRSTCEREEADRRQRERDAVRAQHDRYWQSRQSPAEQASSTPPDAIQQLRDGMERVRREEEAQRAYRERIEMEARILQRAWEAWDEGKRNLAEQKARELQQMRTATEARVTALRATFPDPQQPDAFEWLQLVHAALPNRDLAQVLAAEGYARFPERLQLVSALALTLQCAPENVWTDDDGDTRCKKLPHEEAIPRLATALPAAPLIERMRACALVESTAFDMTGMIGKKAARRMKGAAHLAGLQLAVNACETGIPEVPAPTRDKLWKHIAEWSHVHSVGLRALYHTESWNERWHFVMNPDWQALADSGYQDLDLLDRMLNGMSLACHSAMQNERCETPDDISWLAGTLRTAP